VNLSHTERTLVDEFCKQIFKSTLVFITNIKYNKYVFACKRVRTNMLSE